MIHTFAYKIQDGSLSGELIRPIHPMLTNALVNNIAFKVLTIMGLIPDMDHSVLSLQARFQRRRVDGYFGCIPAMILGFFVGYLAFRRDHRPGLLDDTRLFDP